ncbi:MAG: DUF998 domain-containing protein [Rubrobacteraceae bacterium]|nr:DUF998 domain-containing protein [Rubrobacteraceae bacterium]
MKGTGKRAGMIRAAAIGGMAGPVLFVGVLVVLTVVQVDFMLGIGWQPLGDPAGAWPSGLALGPYGWAQISNFVVSGLLLAIFALGLHRGVTDGHGSRIGPGLLFVAGIAMALMSFETDPIQRTTPRTPHGWIHDLAYVLFALALLCALYFLWRRLTKDPPWRNHARYTLATGILATLLLALPGVAYYLFLAVVLLWIGATGFKLWRSTVGSNKE